MPRNRRKLTAAEHAALVAIKEKRGKLHAEDVIDAAREPSSSLHKRFTWDDTEAAREWRMHEARCLISLHISYIEIQPGDVRPVRTYFALETDRANTGGYTHIENILSDEAQYQQLLSAFIQELIRLEKQFCVLKEAKPIWAAKNRLLKKLKKFGSCGPKTKPKKQKRKKGRRRKK